MRAELERDVERLIKEIKDAREVRSSLEINEEDIEAFIKEVEYIMEHPSELLLDATNTTQQKAMFAFVFSELPTYDEILSGTPKLRWIFKVSSEDISPESVLVRPPGLEPGTLSLKGICSTS